MLMKHNNTRCWQWLLALLVLLPIGSRAQNDSSFEMVIQQKGGSEVAIPIAEGYPKISSFISTNEAGEQISTLRVNYEGNEFYDIGTDHVSNLISRPAQSLSLETITENLEVDFTNKFTGGENLFNRVIDKVYFSMDSQYNNGYNELEKGLVLYSSPMPISYVFPMSVGDYRLPLKFQGLIVELPAAKGCVKVNALTRGEFNLVIAGEVTTQGWNQTFTYKSEKRYQLDTRQDAEWEFDLKAPSYLYISAAREQWSEEIIKSNNVVIYGLTVTINSTGVENIKAQPDNYDIYTTDGRLLGKSATSLRKLPNGIYVIRQNNRQTYKYISR